MSVANKIVAETLRDLEYCGVGVGPELESYLTPADALRVALFHVEECADEHYDAEWFALVATKRIRDRLDWGYICDVLNEEVYDRNVFLLFGE